MAKKKEKKEAKKTTSQIHFSVPANLKRDWVEKGKLRGHNTLKSCIVSAMFNYLYLQTADSSNFAKLIDELKGKLTIFNTIEEKLAEKTRQIETLDYDLDIDFIEKSELEALKKSILEKIKMYQPIAIMFLSQVTKIPGPHLLPVLKEMTKDGLIQLTEKYEWCLK